MLRIGQRLLSSIKAKHVFRVAWATSLVFAGAIAIAQEFRFTEVEINGNQRIADETILSYSGIARGERLSAAELNTAYQNIIASGLFESVEIVPSGNRLVIDVSEYPTINRINFEGNRRIKDDALEALIESRSRRIFKSRVAEADAERIVAAYANTGRLSARVEPRIIRRSDNRVDLVFEILEGGLVEIERLSFVGNKAFTDRRLRRVLETKQAGLLRAVIRRDTFVEDRIEFDKQVLQDFYFSRGYVDFKTNDVSAELTRARDGYFLIFNITEGQKFRLGTVEVTSDIAGVDLDKFRAALRLTPGDVYSPTAIDTNIARLERLGIQEDVDFLRVAPRISRNSADRSLDVTFELARGQRVFVERIDIEGNVSTLDRVIRQQFRVAEGDAFNPREIRESAERIRALGYFENAEVNARPGTSDEQVIIDVDVEEKPTGSLSLGGSYSTSSGFGVLIQYNESNFLGRGQLFNFAISTADEDRNYSLNFVEPAFLGRDLALGIGASYRETNSKSARFNTKTLNLQPSLTFPAGPNSDFGLRVGFERSEITDVGSNVGKVIRDEAALGERDKYFVGYTYRYDSRAAGLNADSALTFSFSQDFGASGDDSYVETRASFGAQQKVYRGEVTLRAEMDLGHLSYSKGSSRVTDRFSLNSRLLRGFRNSGVGPRERSGNVDDPLGGNSFAVARFEAEFPLGLPEEYGITGGTFYDVGSLWSLDNSNSDVLYEEFSLRHAAGLSIFWTTPIGPLRFNFSRAIKKEEYDRDMNFEFTISTKF